MLRNQARAMLNFVITSELQKQLRAQYHQIVP